MSEHQTGGTDRADAGMSVHRKWPWQKLQTKKSTSSCWLYEWWQKAAAVGDQEGTCQLGWEALHRWVRKVQTHQNQRHCQNNVFVSSTSTRLRSKLLKCSPSQTLSSLPAHWYKAASTVKWALALGNTRRKPLALKSHGNGWEHLQDRARLRLWIWESETVTPRSEQVQWD